MFDGLRFCTFINGWDMLASHSFDVLDRCREEVQTSTLHIFKESDVRAQMLFQSYGGTKDNSCANFYLIDDNTRNFQISNAIGKYLVDKKKELLSERSVKSAAMLHLQHPQNDGQDGRNASDTYYYTNIRSPEDGLQEQKVLDIEKTRMRISKLESKAISLINSSIVSDPPKALMAVIDQNGGKEGIVGGWEGPKDEFRSSDFKNAGGSPCPKDFILPRKDRA